MFSLNDVDEDCGQNIEVTLQIRVSGGHEVNRFCVIQSGRQMGVAEP